MPTRYEYTDAFLALRITQAREDQAVSDINDLGTLPKAWVARLVVLQSYIIVCLESMSSAEDTFSAKLAAYRKQYDAALVQARAAQQKVESAAGTPQLGGGSFFTAELNRG